MKPAATPGGVFQFLRLTGDPVSLERFLPVEPDRLLRWIRDEEPIDEARLEKALKKFGCDRETYDFLCTL